MAKEYLDKNGLAYFWSKIKGLISGIKVTDEHSGSIVEFKDLKTQTYATKLLVDIEQTQGGTPWLSQTTDVAPYTFRKSPNINHEYNSEIDKIVGGTVAWNQLVSASDAVNSYEKYGVTFTKGSTGFSFVTSGTYSYSSGDRNCYISNSPGNRQVIAGHKYLFTNTSKYYCVYVYSYSADGITFSGNRLAVSNQSGVVVTPDKSGKCMISLHSGSNIANGTSMSETIYINMFDLTQMFGSTIADYIYSLEQSTAGAGVAWFRNLFPSDYYAYDAGTLKSVEGLSAHKTVGKNLFDKSAVTNGKYLDTTTGLPVNATGYCVSDYIPVKKGLTVYIPATQTARRWFYDTSKTPTTYLNNTNGQAYTPPADGYIRVSINTTSIDIDTFQIAFGTATSTYEPYDGHTYALDSDLTLRGVPKLDSSNNLYYDGDTYESTGAVTRRYGSVDLGTLSWSAGTDSTGQYFYSASSTGAKSSASASSIPNVVCSKYVTSPANAVGEKNLAISSGATPTIYVRDTSYSDAATFKTAMNGVYLVYELATPTTETADPFTSPQSADPLGTEEYVSTSIVPVGHQTQYANIFPMSGYTQATTYVSPSTSASEATLYNVSFGTAGTVYGGTLDVLSGVLTATHAIVTFNGGSEEQWEYYSVAQGNLFRHTQSDRESGALINKKVYCNCFRVVDYADRTNGTLSSSNSGGEKYFDFIYDDCNSVATWKTWLSSNNVQVVYPLATSQTYQLTPTEVQMLLGDNYIWSDVGGVDVAISAVPTNVSAFTNDAGYLTLATLPVYNGGVQ